MASFHDEHRWPPLLVALRRATRPDRARVAAYAGMFRSPSGWDAYAEFLAAHGAWLDALDRALARSGAAHLPLRDGAEEGFPREAQELPSPRTRAHALGYLYVYEAFRLGRTVLARRLRGREEVEARADEAGRSWRDLAAQLERVPIEEHGAVVQGALDAFAEWERQLGAALARLGLAPGEIRAA